MSTLQALLLPSDFIGLCNLFLLYIAYSTLGWCGEMLYCSIPKGHLCEKRGFLNGFLCPIYGHGALRDSADIFERRLLHSHPDIRKSREDLLAAIRARLNESEAEAKRAADGLFNEDKKD